MDVAVAVAVAVARDFVVAVVLRLLTFGFPSAATEPTDETPQGRRARMHVVFRHDRDVVSKNPGGGVNPARGARGARRQGVLSFGYFSLHEQRKLARFPERGAKAFAVTSALRLASKS